MIFPVNPKDGDIYKTSNQIYKYNISDLSWKKIPIVIPEEVKKIVSQSTIDKLTKLNDTSVFNKSIGSVVFGSAKEFNSPKQAGNISLEISQGSFNKPEIEYVFGSAKEFNISEDISVNVSYPEITEEYVSSKTTKYETE